MPGQRESPANCFQDDESGDRRHRADDQSTGFECERGAEPCHRKRQPIGQSPRLQVDHGGGEQA